MGGQVHIDHSIGVVIMTQLRHNLVSLISQSQVLLISLALGILDILMNQGIAPISRGQILFKLKPGASQRHPVVDSNEWPLW